jgi:hypothetical protein
MYVSAVNVYCGYVYTCIPDTVAFGSDVRNTYPAYLLHGNAQYFQRNYRNGEMLFRSASESCTFRIAIAPSDRYFFAPLRKAIRFLRQETACIVFGRNKN